MILKVGMDIIDNFLCSYLILSTRKLSGLGRWLLSDQMKLCVHFLNESGVGHQVVLWCVLHLGTSMHSVAWTGMALLAHSVDLITPSRCT